MARHLGQTQERFEVPAQREPTIVAVDERESREAGQFEAFVESETGSDASIGERDGHHQSTITWPSKKPQRHTGGSSSHEYITPLLMRHSAPSPDEPPGVADGQAGVDTHRMGCLS